MKDIVFVSSSLKDRYPILHHILETNLLAHGIEFETILSSNIWCRDYLPIQTKSGNYVKFRYKTEGYDIYLQLKVEDDIGDFPNVKFSDLILDGGNCQMYRDRAIITNVVFNHNPQYDPVEIVAQLTELLEAEIIIIPPEPGDELGHADGIVKWLNQYYVLVNEYQGDEEYEDYSNRLSRILKINNLRAVCFPNFYHSKPALSEEDFRKAFPFGDAFNDGYGYAINFLKVKRLVFLPVFGIPEDVKTVETARTYFTDCSIIACDCRDISREGGLMHCITKEYKVKC